MQRNVAYLLLIVMLGLIALGLVMLTSTSAVLASQDMAGVYSNLRKQLVWLGIGGIVCVFLSRYDYQKLLRHAPWLLGVACFMLVLCLIPHVGVRINGSPRWLRLRGLDLSAFGIRQAGADSFPVVVDGKKSAPCPASYPRAFAGRCCACCRSFC